MSGLVLRWPEPLKTCSCGRSFAPAAWAALRLVGYQDVPAGEDEETEPGYVLEIRDCPCGSTLSMEGHHA